MAASIRTQASQASSSAEAELYAMGMAVHDSLHLKSFLQEMQISQLAKPFELTVFTDSCSGEALALKLGLTSKKASMVKTARSLISIDSASKQGHHSKKVVLT